MPLGWELYGYIGNVRFLTVKVARPVSYTHLSTTTKKSTYDSYDDGYDDIYMDGDYDYDRYDRDSDYADGVDDAMDEDGEDW